MMAAAQRMALEILRANRPDDGCTTASNDGEGLSFRVRRIKTFESERPAKFHNGPQVAYIGPQEGVLAGLCSEYCPRRAALRGWRRPVSCEWGRAGRADSW